MFRKGAGDPRRQAEGLRHRPHEATKASASFCHDDTDRAALPAEFASTFYADSVGRHVGPSGRRRRINPAGLVVYAFSMAAVFYLAGHVAVALLGWHGLAALALAALYFALLGWSISAMRHAPGRRP